MTITFEVGTTYETRSIGDHNCKITATIARRTAKTITTEEGKTFRVKIWNGVEQFMPWGRCSMAPIMGADDKI
jgi:hypothetical protein